MRRKNWRASALLAGAGAFISAHFAFADTPATWNVDAVGSWTNGSLWSTSPNFPNNFGATTYDAVINSTGAVVELDAPITISGLGMLAGTLMGGSELTVIGGGSWLGGTIAGTGTINIASSLRIDGTDHTFSNYTINIGSLATATWNSHRIIALTGVEGGVINNAGTFDDQTDDDWYWDNIQTPVFNNSGLFLKSAGSDGFAKSFWAVMNNSGEVHVQTSGLWLAGGGTSGGSFNVDSGALLQISDFNQNFAGAGAPTTVFSSSATLSSLGSVVFSHSFGSSVTEFNGTYDSAATVIDVHDPGDNTDEGRVTFTNSALVNSNFSGSLQVISGTVRFETAQPNIGFTDGTFSGGTLSTANDLFFDTMTWSGGTISGENINNISTGALTITGTDPKQLRSVNFYNGIGSHATISEGSLSILDATVINLDGATFDFQGDASLVNEDPDNFFSGFVNGGTLVKSGGTGLSSLSDVTLYNSGTVLVQSGTLKLGGGGNHSGTMIISNGATLELGGGVNAVLHEFASGAVIQGEPGSELRIVGPVSLDEGAVTNLDRLTVENASLGVSSTMSIASMRVQNGGFVALTGGTLSASGDVQIAASGTGRMDLFSGSRVNSHHGFIAPAPGSNGSVTIDTFSSSWSLTGDLYVGGGTSGSGGSGSLTVVRGGWVSSANGYVASRPGSTGVVNIMTVNPPGTPAAWLMSGSFFVGGNASAAGGAATVNVGTGGAIGVEGNTKVWNNGVIHYNDGTFSTGTLALVGGGDFIMAPGNNLRLIVSGAISTDAANGSKLDVADNSISLFQSVANPSSSIRSQIQAGYHGGDWTGNGITTSMGDTAHGLGYKGDSFAMDIKYTYLGDANLSGFVDVADLLAAASHFNTSGDVWTQGDFNYDGVVDITDLKIMARNWGAGMGAPLGAPALGPLLASLGLPSVETPEPTGLCVLVLTGCLLRRRRRFIE